MSSATDPFFSRLAAGGHLFRIVPKFSMDFVWENPPPDGAKDYVFSNLIVTLEGRGHSYDDLLGAVLKSEDMSRLDKFIIKNSQQFVPEWDIEKVVFGGGETPLTASNEVGWKGMLGAIAKAAAAKKEPVTDLEVWFCPSE